MKKKLKQGQGLKTVATNNNNARQLKMDKFVVKKKVKSPSPTKTSSQNKNANNDLGKRSTTLQAKNYRYVGYFFVTLLQHKWWFTGSTYLQ